MVINMSQNPFIYGVPRVVNTSGFN